MMWEKIWLPLCSAAGFKVIDLGVDISPKQFIKAVRQNPDVSIVCLSSLLTTACSSMQHAVKAIRQSDTKHRLKIMVGGSTVAEKNLPNKSERTVIRESAIGLLNWRKPLLYKQEETYPSLHPYFCTKT